MFLLSEYKSAQGRRHIDAVIIAHYDISHFVNSAAFISAQFPSSTVLISMADYSISVKTDVMKELQSYCIPHSNFYYGGAWFFMSCRAGIIMQEHGEAQLQYQADRQYEDSVIQNFYICHC